MVRISTTTILQRVRELLATQNAEKGLSILFNFPTTKGFIILMNRIQLFKNQF
jgi:hypothetical protein